MPTKPVTKEEMINSYKSVERRQSSSSRMFGGYDFEYINLYNAGELMDSWAALQTGERDEEIERLKGLIKDAWWVHSYGTSNSFDSTGQYDAAWNQFKTDNKL